MSAELENKRGDLTNLEMRDSRKTSLRNDRDMNDQMEVGTQGAEGNSRKPGTNNDEGIDLEKDQ